jgi:hypothetical protein
MIDTETLDLIRAASTDALVDVRAETLNECFYADQDEQPDVCKLASHWAPHPKNAGI